MIKAKISMNFFKAFFISNTASDIYTQIIPSVFSFFKRNLLIFDIFLLEIRHMQHYAIGLVFFCSFIYVIL